MPAETEQGLDNLNSLDHVKAVAAARREYGPGLPDTRGLCNCHSCRTERGEPPEPPAQDVCPGCGLVHPPSEG